MKVIRVLVYEGTEAVLLKQLSQSWCLAGERNIGATGTLRCYMSENGFDLLKDTNSDQLGDMTVTDWLIDPKVGQR